MIVTIMLAWLLNELSGKIGLGPTQPVFAFEVVESVNCEPNAAAPEYPMT